MKRVNQDFKKYYQYILYSTKAELKNEVFFSYLGWIWWLLEPMAFMLIYAFISIVVFNSKESFFAPFVLIGLAVWNFFSQTISTSVKLIPSNKAIITKIYIPKFVFIFTKLFKNIFKMFLLFWLVLFFIVIYKITLSIKIIYFFPLMIVLILVTFGISTILLHFGVFIEDLSNVINIVLRLVFYLSGIFYSITNNVPEPYNNLLLQFNPIALIIDSLRQIILYNTLPNYEPLLNWLFIGLLLSIIGMIIIYKNENSYVKVMK